jgi:hypothetical protein
MSLIITFITKNDSEIEEPNNGLFGFEIWRKSLWGNPIMYKLGCEIIPTLQNTDIFATEKNLEKLKGELLIIKNNIIEISKCTEVDKDTIMDRVSNALEFIKIAEENNNIIGINIG